MFNVFNNISMSTVFDTLKSHIYIYETSDTFFHFTWEPQTKIRNILNLDFICLLGVENCGVTNTLTNYIAHRRLHDRIKFNSNSTNLQTTIIFRYKHIILN